MASEGPNSPGTVVDDNSVGTAAWSLPTRASASDDSRTIATGGPGLGTFKTHYLKATNFGFSIPGGATIDGILEEIERHYTNSGGGLSDVTDNEIKIVKGETVGSTNRSAGATWNEDTDSVDSFGGASDLWGESWTVSDINSSGFGAVLAADLFVNTAVTINAKVDHVKITVYYTTPSGLPAFHTILKKRRSPLLRM